MKIELTLEEITLIKQTLYLSIDRLKDQPDHSIKLLTELEALYSKVETLQENCI